jgi:pimeloyl-ACP methyl ester carboxylesterase
VTDDLDVRALSRLVDGGVRRGELGRDGRVLRWAQAGSGGPVVVLDAALGEPGSLAYAGVMPLVAPRARVLAYDRAGIGASGPALPLTLATQVADLAALARDAGGGCVLAGHNWGAMLAQLVTLRHPGLVAGLVLIDPAEEDLLASLPPEDASGRSAPGRRSWMSTRAERSRTRRTRSTSSTPPARCFACCHKPKNYPAHPSRPAPNSRRTWTHS